MKYLIVSKVRNNLPPERGAAIFLAAKAWVESALKSKTVDFVYAFPNGGVTYVVNADSHEALMTKMREFPLYPFHEHEIRPLVDANASFDLAIQMFGRWSKRQ